MSSSGCRETEKSHPTGQINAKSTLPLHEMLSAKKHLLEASIARTT